MTDKDLIKLANILKGENIDNLLITDAWNNYISAAPLTCREETIKYYKHEWSYAFKYITSRKLVFLREIDINFLTQLQVHYKNLGYSNTSINKFTDIIKIVYRFNFIHGFISSDPIRDIKKLKEQTPETITIEDKTRTKIIKYLDTLDNKDIFNLRNKLIIYILDETGVRLNELLHIKTKNVDVENNTIFLEFTKTGKPREVFFSEKTKGFIKQYLAAINPSMYFFQDLVNSKPMTRVSVYKLLDKVKRVLKIEQSITPHKWRHTLATNLMNNNLPIKEVQTVLGHTQLTTTQRYLHSNQKKTKKDVLDVLKKTKD